MLNPIAALLIEVLEIYKWVVIAAVIVSWLIFNAVNVNGALNFSGAAGSTFTNGGAAPAVLAKY